jgi:hypothetical protein
MILHLLSGVGRLSASCKAPAGGRLLAPHSSRFVAARSPDDCNSSSSGIAVCAACQVPSAASSQVVLVRLSRSRISVPVLKNGTVFFSTETCAPVRGLRPGQRAGS